jgi:SSS family solute:Na+ symporter
VSFLCDALQTLGAGVNSIAATLGGKAAAPTASAEARAADEKRGIRNARITTLVVGLVTTVLALGAATYAQRGGQTIFDMLPRMFNMFLGPLAVLFMTGMFFRRATTWTAIFSILATQLFSMTWSWWNEVPGLLEKLRLPGAAAWWIGILGWNESGAMRTPSVMLAIFVPVAAGLLLSAATAWLFGRDGQPGAEWTWKKVVGRDGAESADRETKV